MIISASPRIHGSSDLLCDEFARGAMESGNSVEKIFRRFIFTRSMDSSKLLSIDASLAGKSFMTKIFISS